MAGTILSKLKVIVPNRFKPKGSTQTATYNAENNTEVLSLPDYREHLEDIYSTRTSDTSQEIILKLVKSDPDASAALGAYLTTAGSSVPYIIVKDPDGAIDRDGAKIVNELIEALETRRDYSKGYLRRKTLRELSEEFRYMLLARGGIGCETVFGDQLELTELRNIDMASIRWQEKEPGKMVPWQDQGGGDPIKMDIPSFFVAWYRKSPVEAYGHSPFISAINTMAARQQVINDLYRIMQVTGFPRIAIKVLEEVLVKNAPADVKADPQKMRTYISQRRQDIGSAFATLRPDQAMVHTDSAEVSMLNEKNPATGIKIQEVIDTLNAQNQAGLKTMATVLGRGESGVNTATVEANLFAKNADSLNEPIGEILGSMLTMALRLQGSESRVIVRFPNIDLRSELELEAQLNLKSNRLRTDLSDGLITDDDYHIAMYRRIRPDAVPELSGTGFVGGAMEVDAEKVSPNSDPQGRSVSRASDKSAKSNANQS